jgi:signal transduction histidine kinase
LNILANAIDALDNSAQPNLSKKIVISTGLIKKNKWVRISVTDNADGISEAVQSRIFDPFFTTKPIGKGTGMGMAISYQIITEKHGGYLKCVSQEMSGSQFLIDIPIAQSMKRDRSSGDS